MNFENNEHKTNRLKLVRTFTKYNPNYKDKKAIAKQKELLEIKECDDQKSQSSDSFSCGSGFNSEDEKKAKK